MVHYIKKWIEENHLDVTWVSDIVFRLDQKDYLCLDHKEEKIFDDQFNFILSEGEQQEILIDRYCFSFGGNVYWSGVRSDRPELNILKHIGRAKDITGFSYLGIHGGYELCSGSRLYEDWVNKAQWMGISTLGICEKNTLAGTLKFQKQCLSKGIKPIIGETVTVVKSNKDTYMVKVFVCNDIGWQSLLEINRIINVDSPSRSIDEQIITSGLPGITIVIGECDLDQSIVEAYTQAYDQVYFQIDPCQFKAADRDKKKLERYRNYIRNFYNWIPPILICDSYYLDQGDSHIRQVLNKIGDVGFDYQSEDQWFKDLNTVIQQLDEMFTNLDIRDQVIEDCLLNLDVLTEGIDFVIPTGQFNLPQYTMTDKESKMFSSSKDLIWGLLQEGLEKKVIEAGKDIETYLSRLEYEIGVIDKGGFIDYFLILHDIIRWCDDNGILTGLGRGSAAGALTSYLLGITKIDPIEYDLLFERFLNSSRAIKTLKEEWVVVEDSDGQIHETKNRKVTFLRNGRKVEDFLVNLLPGDELEI